jgi:transposase
MSTLSDAETLTPPEVARILRVSSEKVIGWLLAGELEGFDAATKRGGRPRYRITREALADFQRRRSAAVDAKPARPKRRPFATGKQYF